MGREDLTGLRIGGEESGLCSIQYTVYIVWYNMVWYTNV